MGRKRLTTEEFIKRARAVHGDKYDYSRTVYTKATEKVTIVCPEHGPFLQYPSNHRHGRGCPACAGNRRMDTAAFVERARDVHGDKYDYSKVDYRGAHEDVEIVCPEHGSFMQDPMTHLQGHGCPACAHERKRKSAVKAVAKPKTVAVKDDDGVEARRRQRRSPFVAVRETETPVHVAMRRRLVARYGADDVEEAYSDARYPYRCAFHIRSIDLFVEDMTGFAHGGHWFDASAPDDVARLDEWKRKSGSSALYREVVRMWSEVDVARRRIISLSSLNFKPIWTFNELRDL